MKCKVCNAVNNDGSKFCFSCGADLEKQRDENNSLFTGQPVEVIKTENKSKSKIMIGAVSVILVIAGLISIFTLFSSGNHKFSNYSDLLDYMNENDIWSMQTIISDSDEIIDLYSEPTRELAKENIEEKFMKKMTDNYRSVDIIDSVSFPSEIHVYYSEEKNSSIKRMYEDYLELNPDFDGVIEDIVKLTVSVRVQNSDYVNCDSVTKEYLDDHKRFGDANNLYLVKIDGYWYIDGIKDDLSEGFKYEII